jgi:hypothetical protein
LLYDFELGLTVGSLWGRCQLLGKTGGTYRSGPHDAEADPQSDHGQQAAGGES